MSKILLALLAAALAFTVAAAPASARTSNCQRAGTKTLEADTHVRVFYRGSRAANRKYACFVRTGRVTPLGAWDADLDDAGIANLVAVSGSFVAYHDLECAPRDGDCSESQVRVLNARTGAIRRSPKAGPGAAGIAGLAVRSNGQSAYLREFSGGIRRLHLMTGSATRTVDESADIEPFSLAFAGRILYWTRGGAAQSTRG